MTRFRIGRTPLALLLALAAPAAAWAQGNGLIGEYYSTNNFTGAVTATRPNEGPIDFDYLTSGPVGIPSDNFSVRWRGQLEAPSTENITLFIQADDVGRLFVNGTQQINITGNTGQYILAATAGTRYDICIEHVENTGSARIHFRWTVPSLTITDQPVPVANLYSPTAIPAAPVIAPASGDIPLPAGADVTITTATVGASLRYTNNRTDPGFLVPAGGALTYTVPFNITTYQMISARAYLLGVSSPLSTRQFSPLQAAVTLPAGAIQDGVFFQFYFGAGVGGNNVPNFTPLVPQQQGIMPAFSTVFPAALGARPVNDNFAFQETAWINAPTAGFYTFQSSSDDGSFLYIDGTTVVANDGGHGQPGPTPTGSVQLAAGWHLIRAGQAQGGGGEGLAVTWQPPGAPALTAIPAGSLRTYPQPVTPVITPNGGNFSGSQVVTLTCPTPGAIMYWTTDGTTPNPVAPVNAQGSGPNGVQFTLTSTATIRVVAVVPGINPSSLSRADFTRSDNPPALTSAIASGVDTQLIAAFNRAVDPATANVPGNYTINGPTVSAAALIAPPAASLRARWSFDTAVARGDQIDDISGNANHGNTAAMAVPAADTPTPQVTPLAPLQAGLNNLQSVNYDATDNIYVDNSASLNFGNSSFTVMAWIRPPDANQHHLINKWDDAGQAGWIFDINAGTIRFRMDQTGSGNNHTATSSAVLTLNQWQHVAAVVDRLFQRIFLYRNGVLVGQADMATNFGTVDHTARLQIGRLNLGSIGTPNYNLNGWTGSLDDIRIYSLGFGGAELAGWAAGLDFGSTTVRLTTSTLAPATPYTLTAQNVTDAGGAVMAAPGVLPFQFAATGNISREVYLNTGGGGQVADLTRNAVFPSAPSSAALLTSFEAPTNQADQFGSRMRGYFIPAATGTYRMAIAADDGSQLWISPTEDPAHKVLVSFQFTWAPVRDFADADVVQGIVPFTLTAGQKYYVEALYKEGGGGDNCAVATKIEDGTPIAINTLPIAGAQLSPYTAPVTIVTHPLSRVATVGQGVTFTVGIAGGGPLTFQWRRNGVNVGTNSPTLTIAAVAAGDAGTYDVLVTGPVNNVTSNGALLTVIDPTLVPTLSNVNPPGGSTLGSTSVVLTGTNFVDGLTAVSFGSNPALSVTFNSSSSLTVVTPPGAAGAVTVTVTTANGSAALPAAYTYATPPTLNVLVAPNNAGPTAAGNSVTLTGANFTATPTVRFGTVAATSVVVNGTFDSLTCIVPAPIPFVQGPVDVSVETPGGTATQVNGYRYWDLPTIATIVNGTFLANGPVAGTNSVTITGTNLAPGSVVDFGGPDGTLVVVNGTFDSLTTLVPAGAAGTVVVTVTTPGGTTAVGLNYTYHAVPTLTSLLNSFGDDDGTSLIQVNGTNFPSGLTTVTFDTTASGTVNFVTTFQVTAIAPAHAAGVVPVTVTTPGGTTAPLNFTYYGDPTFLSIDVQDGPSAGGTAVIIQGTNFVGGQTSVNFGGTIVPAAVTGTTSLLVTTPVHAAGNFTVFVVTPGGQIAVPGGFTWHDPPTVTNIIPNTGISQGNQGFTINGTNLSPNRTTIQFGGPTFPATNVIATGAQATGLTPAHPDGLVTVTVITPGGSATTSFTYTGPFVSGIVPPIGPTTGNQAVVINGAGLTGVTSVTIGGVPATGLSVTGGGSQINATTPAGTAGAPVDVVVVTPSGTFTLAGAYTYVAAPTLGSVTPNQGLTTGGLTVTLSGTGFAGGFTTVSFGGFPGTAVNVLNTTTLTVVTPAQAAGTVNVTVSTFGGAPTASVPYTYIPPVTVSGINPRRGPTTGGQTVTFTGANFVQGFTTVTFDGLPGGTPAVTGGGVGTTMTVTTPAHAAGNAVVVVTTFNDPARSFTVPTPYTYVDATNSVDLNLTKIVDNPTPGLGTDVTFTVTLSNTGASAGTGITVNDLLPAGLTFVSAVASTGTYSAGTGVWTVGNLGTPGTATLTVVATVATSAALTNVAEVGASTPEDVDSTPANGATDEDDRATASVSANLTIQTASALPDGTSRALYSQTLSATGGVPALTWSLDASTPAFPFNLDPDTGTISGIAPDVLVPTLYSFTIRLTDGVGTTTTKPFTLTINPTSPAGTVTVNGTPIPPDGTRGVAYSHTFSANGATPPYTWAVTAGALPGGLALNSSTGTVAGTPTASGPFNFTLQATPTTGTAGTLAFAITINPNPISFVTAAALPGGSVGAPYSQPIEVTGGLGPTFTWSVTAGALPGGMALNGTGRTATLSGTPGGNGTFNFTIQAADNGQGGFAVTRAFSLVVAPGGAPFTVSTTSLPDTTQTALGYSATLTGSGGSLPYTWSIVAGALPPGLALNGTSGAITGSATASGVYSFTVQGTPAVGTPATAALSIDVAPVPSILTPDPLPAATQGTGYFQQFTAAGGTAPLAWSSTALPAGLSLSSSSGALSGTPSVNGPFSFTVTATDALGVTDANLYNLTIVNPGAGLAVSGTLPAGTAGVPYSASMQAVGGTPPYTWSLSAGVLPGWAAFNAATGTVSGTPTAGSTSLTFTVTDAVLATASSGAFNLVITSPLVITTAALPGADPGLAYAATLTASGGTGTLVWSVVGGALPPGLSLSPAGLITGTTAGAGNYTVRFRVSDGAGELDERQFSLLVAVGASFADAGSSGKDCSLATAQPGVSGSFLAALLLLAGLALTRKGMNR